MGILEKIADIEREMARTQKNKGASLSRRVDGAQQTAGLTGMAMGEVVHAR